MTRVIIFFLMSAFTSIAFSAESKAEAVSISCSDSNGYELEVSLDVLETLPPKSKYTFSKDGEKLKSGVLIKDLASYDSFLNAYYWAFRDLNDTTDLTAYDANMAFLAREVKVLTPGKLPVLGASFLTTSDGKLHEVNFKNCFVQVL